MALGVNATADPDQCRVQSDAVEDGSAAVGADGSTAMAATLLTTPAAMPFTGPNKDLGERFSNWLPKNCYTKFALNKHADRHAEEFKNA